MDKKGFAIYSRKSKFTGRGDSVENQIELCRRYIASDFPNMKDVQMLTYEDEGFSGKDLDRPQFKKMMMDGEKGLFHTIVVYRLDRISRNIGDFAKLIERLAEMDINFISIKEQFDTSSPMGRAMMYIASVFSQLERETIAERIRDNMYELAKTGRWLGGVTPTGYSSECVRKIAFDGKIRKLYKLKSISEEQELVKLIFKEFLRTNSLAKTEAFLSAGGYISKNGKPFSRRTIKDILQNPVYMTADIDAFNFFNGENACLFSEKGEFDGKRGMMVYNRTVQTKGKSHEINPIEKWIAAVGEHEGLISGDEWIKIREIFESNRRKEYKKPRGDTALLSGVLKCGCCGSFMRPKITGKPLKSGERTYTYICREKEKSNRKNCDMKNLSGKEADRAVLSAISKLCEDREAFLKSFSKMRSRLYRNLCDDEEISLSKRMKSIKCEINALVLSLAEADEEGVKGCILECIREKDRIYKNLEMEYKALCEKKKENNLSAAQLYEIAEKLCGMEYALEKCSVIKKREIIRKTVKNVLWLGNNVQICFINNDKMYPA